jgi:hypothetical protein
MSESGLDPFERWLAASWWQSDSVSIGHLVSHTGPNGGEPDPWAGTDVSGLSPAQREYLTADQPATQRLRPAIPGVEGFEA